MKYMKTVTVPATTKRVVDHVVCDLCGETIGELDYFEIDEIEVSRKKGDNFPEGRIGETVSVDLCGECFDERLIPWLKSKGAKPHTEDW